MHDHTAKNNRNLLHTLTTENPPCMLNKDIGFDLVAMAEHADLIAKRRSVSVGELNCGNGQQRIMQSNSLGWDDEIFAIERNQKLSNEEKFIKKLQLAHDRLLKKNEKVENEVNELMRFKHQMTQKIDGLNSKILSLEENNLRQKKEIKNQKQTKDSTIKLNEQIGKLKDQLQKVFIVKISEVKRRLFVPNLISSESSIAYVIIGDP